VAQKKQIEAAGDYMMTLRLSDELRKMLVRVSAKLPATTPHAVARLALRCGLEDLDRKYR
jgi:hypothetical protein